MGSAILLQDSGLWAGKSPALGRAFSYFGITVADNNVGGWVYEQLRKHLARLFYQSHDEWLSHLCGQPSLEIWKLQRSLSSGLAL
jgi:hypothetical protein